jgi:hypothetical protein
MDDIEVAKSIIKKSGNRFHCKAINYFSEKGWSAQISPYYLDNSTGKAREIDLVVEKLWIYDDPIKKRYETINIKLFVECKYIPHANVFWFDSKDFSSARDWVITNTPHTLGNEYVEKHHFMESNKVAKLFSTENKKDLEYEVIYKALNQSLNAMVNLRNMGTIIPDHEYKGRDHVCTIEIPVILCNSFDKFYGLDIHDPAEVELIRDNFQLEVNYAYIDNQKSNRNEYFLIDIVSFDTIDAYLNTLQEDIEGIKMIF